MTGQEQQGGLAINGGQWLITTASTAYAFDPLTGTVEKIEDGIPHPVHGRPSPRLQAIEVLRAGERR